MKDNDSIEISAPTVEQAIGEALEKLGAAEDDVVIEVLATARAGMLGLGSRPARVRVTRRPPPEARSDVAAPPPAPPPLPKEPPAVTPAPKAAERPTEGAPKVAESAGQGTPKVAEPTGRGASKVESARQRVPGESAAEAGDEEAGDTQRRTADPEEQVGEATAILEKVLGLMGEKAKITRPEGERDDESIELDIKGDGSGVLIGHHGQTLDALEYLVNRIVARKIRDPLPIMLDTESYRARRRQQLHRMALTMGERAKREHAPITLDPMPPRDRRIVHLALKDDPLLTTRSAGEGFLRAVEILPVEERRERSEREGKRERTRQAVGEQGGFKHGQKRIV